MPFRTAFISLKHRNFRLYWTGQLVSLIGTWVQQVALSWLVLVMTNSPFLLGVVSALGSAPILLFSLPGGVAADRVSKKKLLIVTQTFMMLLAFVLALLTYFEYLKIWHIVILSALSGSVFAFDAPARQAFTVELVGRKDLMNAIALNSMIFNTARILGPALAGVLYATAGPSGCFAVNGFSFLAVIYGLSLVRGESKPKKGPDAPALEEIKVGLKYVWQHPTILSLIAIVGIFSIFGMPYAVLMPVFARDILHLQARGFGLLMTSVGIGAIIGAVSLAAFSQMPKRGRYVLVSGLLFTVAVSVFSLSKNLALSIACLPFMGFTMVSQVATINTIIQSIVPDDIRGRVMSVFTLVFMGMMPVGSFIAGSIAGKFGAPAALQVGATVCLAALIYLFWRNRELNWQ